MVDSLEAEEEVVEAVLLTSGEEVEVEVEEAWRQELWTRCTLRE